MTIGLTQSIYSNPSPSHYSKWKFNRHLSCLLVNVKAEVLEEWIREGGIFTSQDILFRAFLPVVGRTYVLVSLLHELEHWDWNGAYEFNRIKKDKTLGESLEMNVKQASMKWWGADQIIPSSKSLIFIYFFLWFTFLLRHKMDNKTCKNCSWNQYNAYNKMFWAVDQGHKGINTKWWLIYTGLEGPRVLGTM